MEVTSHLRAETLIKVLAPYAAHLKSEHKAAGDKHRIESETKRQNRMRAHENAVTLRDKQVKQFADSLEAEASGFKSAFRLVDRKQKRKDYEWLACKEFPYPSREPWDWGGFPKIPEDHQTIVRMLEVLECVTADVRPILGDAEIIAVSRAIDYFNEGDDDE